jgi:hypothetical protein
MTRSMERRNRSRLGQTAWHQALAFALSVMCLAGLASLAQAAPLVQNGFFETTTLHSPGVTSVRLTTLSPALVYRKSPIGSHLAMTLPAVTATPWLHCSFVVLAVPLSTAILA